MLKRYRLVIVNAVLLLALGGSLYGKRIETANIKKTDFLNRLELPFRDWKYENQPIPPDELVLLEPDDSVVRAYYNADKSKQIQLAVIAGHRKKTVHTPAFCMAGGGWDTITQQIASFNVGGRQIPVSRSIMTKPAKGARPAQTIVVSYFFTDGEKCTTSLNAFQFSQLLRRFGSGIPLGALVRIYTPVMGDGEQFVKAAEDLTEEFANAQLPTVLKTLRETRLETQ